MRHQPDDPGYQIGNVNGDGRDVKNWLLALFSALIVVAAGSVIVTVISLEGRMARVEAKMDAILACVSK